MKQFIQHILSHTPEQHEVFKFDVFLMWCELNSLSQKDLQQLITSQKLLNWYLNQLDLLEDEFIEKVSNAKTLKMTNRQLHDIYNETAEKICQFFPKKILLGIRTAAREERFNNAFTLEYYNGKLLNLN